MKFIFSFLFLSMLLTSSIRAEDDNKDPLVGIEVSSDEISKSLDGMKASGQISQKDYEEAKKQLSGMNSAQIKALSETAIGMVRNNPDKAVELSTQKFNADATKKQINDLSRPKE
jgi:hypothetical protein